MGQCASGPAESSSKPRITATFPGDPDHGQVIRNTSETVSVPKTRSKRKRTRCFMDIAIDGEPAGRLIFELRPDVNPRTCENFRSLCTGEHGMTYKDCKFHKIIPGFVLQTGDVELKTQKKEGRGGVSIYGRSFADEDLKKLKHDEYGVVSMANAGPHTNNSQFMIVVDEKGTDWLDEKHCVFGKIEESCFDTLRAIEDCAEVFDRDEKTRARIVKTATIVDCGEL